MQNIIQNEGRSLEILVSDLCDIILTTKDCLVVDDAKLYIKSLTSSEKNRLNEFDVLKDCERNVYYFIQLKLLDYIQKYQSDDFQGVGGLTSTPFEFDNETVFDEYISNFRKQYLSINGNKTYPEIFDYVFYTIREMSDHYRVFEQFYMIRSKQTHESILFEVKMLAQQETEKGIKKGAQEAAAEAVKDAKDAAKRAENASRQAEMQATIAAKKAEEASEDAKTAAETEVGKVIADKMSEVTSKISETSVTILGIFSGIVLTVVAGLFYSSSVLENIHTANFNKLICIAALVGFVCIQLLAVMFFYLDRFRNQTDSKAFFKKSTKFVSIVLICIFAISFTVLSISETDAPTSNFQNDNDLNATSTTSETSFEATEETKSGSTTNIVESTLSTDNTP